MRIGAAGNDIEASRLQSRGKYFGVFDDSLGVGLEFRLQGFAERHGLRRDDVHQGPALQARKYRGIDLLAEFDVTRKDHSAAWTTECLVRGGRGDVAVIKRIGMHPAGD